MTVDGAVNSKGVGVGIVITSPNEHYVETQSIKLDYPLSNNQAEYEALIMGMVWALSAGSTSSESIQRLPSGCEPGNDEHVVHSDNLKVYAERVTQLKAQFRHFTIEKIDLSKNEAANKLAKIALGETPNDDGIEIEHPPLVTSIQPVRQTGSREPTWIDEIMNYISNDILPLDKGKAR